MHLFRFLFIGFIFCLNSSFGHANEHLIDSLKIAYQNAKHDTTKLQILNQLVESEYNDSIWPLYNQELLELSEQLLNKKNDPLESYYASYNALALNNFGYLNTVNGNLKKAHEFYQKSLQIEIRYQNKYGIATVYNNIGFLCRQEGNIEKAIDYYHRALNIHIELNFQNGIAVGYNNLAFVFDSQGEIDNATKYYKKALSIYTQIDDLEGMAIAYGNLAAIYSKFGDPECQLSFDKCLKNGEILAIEYLKKAIELHQKTGNKSLLAGSLNHIGGLYYEIGDPECNQDSISCIALAKKKALDNFILALNIRLQQQDHQGLSQSYVSLGNFYFKEGNINQSLQYGLLAIETAKKSQSPERILDASLLLKKVYESKKNYRDALIMYEQYITLRDSIHNDANRQNTIRKTFQLEYEVQAKKDSLDNLAKMQRIQLENELKVKQQQYYIYGGLIGFILMLLIALISFRAYRQKQKANIEIQEQKNAVEEKSEIINLQKKVVEEKQKEIVESINYAKRIQEAILPANEFVQKHLKESFILYQPKDIVAGDFYWAEYIHDEDSELFFIAAADSTGHGVPGALVSVVCSTALNRAIKEFKLRDTAKILDKTRELVLETFEKSNTEVKDGMDISLICFNKTLQKIFWSGANNNLWYIWNKELIVVNADKQPIGKSEHQSNFTQHEIPFQNNTIFYLFTDGFADQFGIDTKNKEKLRIIINSENSSLEEKNNANQTLQKGKKFRYKKLQELLLDISQEDLLIQHQKLNLIFNEWKGDLEQVDDVCIIGIRI